MNLRATRVLPLTMVLLALAAAVGAGPSARQIERNIKQAVELTFSSPVESARLFETSFRQALDLTRPQLPKATRELGFALASKCLHPSLFPEVRVAMDTSLALFPNGRYRKHILVQRALLDYAEGRYEDAERGLAEAAPHFTGRELAKFKTLQMNGLFLARKYVSGGDLLESWHEQRPSTTTRRNVKRWAGAEKQVLAALAKAQAGDLDAFATARDLQEAVASGYFVKEAPEAAQRALQLRDAVKPRNHGQDVTWLGLSRTAWHSLPAILRHGKYLNLLESFPEADPALRGQVIRQLWLICRYELDRPSEADRWLARLAEVPGFAQIAELEKALAEVTEPSLATPQGQELMQRIEACRDLFPYDNGVLPVIDLDFVREVRMLTELLSGRTESLAHRVQRTRSSWKVRSVPVHLLYLIAADQKLAAYEEYQKLIPTLAARDRRMVKDFLFPLYKQPTPQERQLLSAFAAAEVFPTLAIDRLLSVLSLLPPQRPVQVNHALALLAELYQKHRNYVEAQSVWTTLRTLYPSSVWIR
ncbi:MAG: hypothetical protein OZSIB_0258 [Candidatus Ozemobacter sibiricus]|jgi:hypothetical protein|uniref:Tetratricopeptide repeat protein n=1 Tax=Candidatus Ozemobacter sibiricus TaxID=2268124 RepID=A0A367ZLZ7_9BACT|nr:MAG: hypothetical protein OZSIB_0258 [Candidatus Ozemobacter sibiricus]